MNSIWKNLLLLHGHLVHKADLAWALDAGAGANRNTSSAGKSGSIAVKCCMAVVWPRLAAPH